MDLLEKIAWGLTIVLLASIGACFMLFGTPTTTARIEAGGRTLANKQEFDKGLDDSQRQQLAEKLQPPPPPTVDGKVGASAPRRPPQQKFIRVNRAALERIDTLNDAQHEARLARSEPLSNEDGTTSLKIFDINEASMLHEYGFENNDVVDYINGQRVDFTSVVEARALYARAMAEMRSGVPQVVQIMRRGQPLQIVIGLD